MDNRNRIKSLDKALQVLELLKNYGPELGIAEINKRLGLGSSTIHRILTTFEDMGYVVQDPDTSKYRLGIKVFELGATVVKNLSLDSQAKPVMARLLTQLNETVHLVILNGGEVVYINKMESSQAVVVPSQVGRRAPAHCTAAGKALLAWLPQDELEEVLELSKLEKYTPSTLDTREKLCAELALIRQRGYSLDNVEYQYGVRCVGAPIFNYSGQICAAISVTGPETRMTDDIIARAAELVMNAARSISQTLGHTG